MRQQPVDFNWIFRIAVAVSVVHVLEEYRFHWVAFANRYVPGITPGQFAAVNIVFIAYTVAGAMAGTGCPVFSMSVPALLFINSFFHIVPSLMKRGYTPGLISAILLYIPLSVYAFVRALDEGLLSPAGAVASFALGILCMAMPVLFQRVRIARAGTGGE
ncbi:MAG: HXXEE domain-containing protein [Spirochaetes bacterium]|nr:HXXEE domain-containing protein [Spirochaetota bacterium]